MNLTSVQVVLPVILVNFIIDMKRNPLRNMLYNCAKLRHFELQTANYAYTPFQGLASSLSCTNKIFWLSFDRNERCEKQIYKCGVLSCAPHYKQKQNISPPPPKKISPPEYKPIGLFLSSPTHLKAKFIPIILIPSENKLPRK